MENDRLERNCDISQGAGLANAESRERSRQGEELTRPSASQNIVSRASLKMRARVRLARETTQDSSEKRLSRISGLDYILDWNTGILK